MRSLAMSFVISLTLYAQLDRGTLTGTITDPTGAVVPNVKITFVNQGTGATSTTVTNEAGQYSRPNLPIGTYQLTGEAPGFKKTLRSGITLGVTEVLRVDVQLELGSTGESV